MRLGRAAALAFAAVGSKHVDVVARHALGALHCFRVAAQERRPLTHDDYDGWKSIRATTVSQDGAWVAYQIEPQWGDGVLEVRSTTGNTVWTHARGSGPRFSADGRFCVFTVGKSKVEERTKKVDELRKKAKEIGRAHV